MQKEKIITIGGGVGPMAGVMLHQLVIQNTRTDGTDQDHLEVHHLSRSHDIPDRTKFLLGEINDDPAEGMLRTLQFAQAAAAAAGKKMVFGVPCNSFHAPLIFDHFLQLIREGNIDIKIINMINETAELIFQLLPGVKKIGLMSTTGTRKVGVYRKVLEPRKLEIIELPEDVQPELHDSIYNPNWGIKAISPVSKQARGNFEKYAAILSTQGAEAIILGCTEIPLALPEKEFKGVPLIDPMLALARALVREANPDKLLPLA